jgi:hypothetical protein
MMLRTSPTMQQDVDQDDQEVEELHDVEVDQDDAAQEDERMRGVAARELIVQSLWAAQ